MVTRGLAHQIKKTIVDEIGTYRIKGNKEIDHNTIVMETGTYIQNTKKTIKRLRMNNTEGWKKYNLKLQQRLAHEDNLNPISLTHIIKETLNETVGQVTISIQTRKKHMECKKLKEARETKKKAKKEYEKL